MKSIAVIAVAALLMTGSARGQTPDTALEPRVGQIEKELRAVQRKVFPNGAPVEPVLSAAPAAGPGGTPANAPLADLTLRVDALEKTLTSLTAQVEQNEQRLRLAEDAIRRLDAGRAAPAAVTPTPPATAPAPAPSTPGLADDARKAAIAAVEVPVTGDAAEDAYTYGYRLYVAKLYPEAQTKLKEVVAKHPKHRRASFAQNLLGRAYFDEGKPALASVAFYDNYQKMPTGERAPESLYWLGQSLTKLNKLPDACKVYLELDEVYAAKLTPDLKAKAVKGRTDAKCTT